MTSSLSPVKSFRKREAPSATNQTRRCSQNNESTAEECGELWAVWQLKGVAPPQRTSVTASVQHVARRQSVRGMRSATSSLTYVLHALTEKQPQRFCVNEETALLRCDGFCVSVKGNLSHWAPADIDHLRPAANGTRSEGTVPLKPSCQCGNDGAATTMSNKRAESHRL